ncbi:HAD-IIIA family hydrolase [Candidatus Harpocratesius sp.]
MNEEKIPKVVAFIPVRGNSKSIPLKNIKNIAGKPLVFWSIEAALSANIISDIFISTDSSTIKETIENQFDNNNKVHVIGRSKESATDTSSSEIVLLEFCQVYSFDYVFFIQATSPLISSSDIDNAFHKLLETRCDSLLSVVRQKRFIWEEDGNGNIHPSNYDYENRPRRQDFNGFLVENGAFYLSSRQNILKSNCRISGKITFFEMREETYYEIDELSDWLIVEQLLKRKIQKEKKNSLPDSILKIKYLILDVDGTLTDGGMYYTESGEFIKKFNTRDAHGLELVRREGITPVLMTSENSSIVTSRAKKMKIDKVYLGCKNKLETLNSFCKENKVSMENIAFIGDDVNDLAAIKKVGFSACPLDAEEQIKENVDYISAKKGGNGAVRDICNHILITIKNTNSLF